MVELDAQQQVIGSTQGLFLDTAGTDSALVVEGDAAPAPAGATLDARLAYVNDFGMNSLGDTVFEAAVMNGGSSTMALFVRSAGGVLTQRAAEGDAPANGGGHTFTTFGGPSINASGDVAFEAALTGGAAGYGLFVDDGSGPGTLALAGDAAPGTGGGTFFQFFFPAVNAGGDVVFLAATGGGTASGGLFHASPTITPLLVDGDSVPGAGVVSALSSLPVVQDDGRVAMSLGFSTGPVTGGVYERMPTGHYAPVALAFEPAPGAGGAVFSSFGYLDGNAAGEVAFQATLDDGRTGIFLATPVAAAVPMLPAPMLPVLAALLVAGGALARRAPPRR